MLLSLLLPGCSFFKQDELASLRASVVDSPGTTLAVATVDAPPDIPPLRAGELGPPPHSVGNGLGVLGVAPQGVEADPSQVAVVFDRPMVPLDAIDATSGAVPIRCTPEIQGRMRWAGTSTAVIVPEGNRFPLGTEYSCKVPAGTAAADGTALEAPLEWSFSTLRPALERSRPTAGESSWDPADPIVLRFNQAVDPAALAGSVHLRTDAGVNVPLRLARGEEKQNRPDIVLARAMLVPDTGYTLVLDVGLRGADGPLGMVAEQIVPFRTYPPLLVKSGLPEGAGVSPVEGLRIEFTTEVDAAEVNKHIRVSPTPPDGWKPAETYTSDTWSYWTRFDPRTRYTVTVEPGIVDSHGQKLAKGLSWTFTTGDLPALVDAPEGFQVYPASNPLTLPIRYRNVSAVGVEVEAVDPLALVLSEKRWTDWRDERGGPTLGITPTGALNKVQVGTIDLAPFLSTEGHGLVRVRTTSPEVRDWNGDPATSVALLQVTDLGTTIKLAPDGVTAWVTRLSDGTPVEGATVRVVRGGQITWTGETGRDGLAIAEGEHVPNDWSSWGEPLWVVVQSGDDVAITNHQWDQGLDGWSFGVWSSFDAEQVSLRFASFTDRGVYRPGDTAHVSVSLRAASLQGLAVPARRDLEWDLRDPNGQQLAAGKGVADDHGAWSVDLALPAEGAIGDHLLEVRQGEDRTYVSIPMRAYRAPAFRADVKAPTEALAGGSIGATAEARYLFGTPMKGAKLKWSVSREPLTLAPAGWEEFSFEPMPDFSEGAERPGYESVSSGEGTLDAEGRFPIVQALPPDTVTRPWTYTIEATVTDTDRQQLSNRATVDVQVAEAYVGVRAPSGLGKVGEPVTVQVVAVTPKGEARIGSPVKLTAVRRSWDVIREKAMDGTWRWVNTPKDEPVGAGTVKTAAQPASWSFSPKDGGYYVIRAESAGTNGAKTLAETGVYVLGGQVSWARSDTRTLELVTDKRSYAPGDTAKVLVKAPKAGMSALVTVEREGVWSRQVIQLTSTAQAVEVPITAAMMPNAFVTVLAVEGAPPATAPDAGKPGIWYGVTPLTVAADGQKVAVALTTDREAYQPQDEVRIHLEAQRDGQVLANARVTLWAVDYGVLSLTAYATPDQHATFYEPRPLGVITADNRISVYDRAHYLAKGADAGGGGGMTDGDTRRKFETTPLWKPDLRTNAKGVLDHTFTLPDNLTTFKIMAVVDDGKAAFGSGEHEVRVNRPLIARPALPRFFRQGDRAYAGVVVHNNTPGSVQVAVNATATGATLKGAPRTVTVAGDGALEVPFALSDFDGTAVKLRFEADGGGNRDAVELSVPVSSPLAQEVVASAGSTTDTAVEAVAVPKGAVPTAGGLTVNVSASALVGMGSAVDYLVEYPHGCLEQVGSRTRVALLARTLGAKAGVETPPEKLDEIVRAGLAKMDSFRTASGGYAYWPGDDATGPSSAYALEILTEAKAAGHVVDDKAIERLSAFVRAFLGGEHVPRWWSADMTRTAQARAALAMARSGQGDPAFNARLWDDRGELPLFGKAELLETLARTTGGDPRTRELSQALEAALKIEATSASLVDRDTDRWTALWYGDDLGTSALVRAWMQAAPTHPMLGRLVHHLVDARKQGRWANTYTTAAALQALRDYTARYETGAVTARVTLAGQPVVEKALGEGGQATAFVPMVGLKPGELAFNGTGGRLYYESRLAYSLPSLAPRDEGFTLTRIYEVLEGSGGGAQVSPGAVVRVTLRAVTPVDRYNVALVDWLPAGLEPIDTTFATSVNAMGGEDTGGGWRPVDTGIYAEAGPHEWTSSWVFNRRELRDDRVALYADHMPAGIHVQTYLARATTPGDYAHPAATIEQMYTPDTFGRTDSGRFVVGFPVASR
ncbi:MAG: Ig-like domain-containing protein [Pseudomonadota bacterium]|nr:Ig-like domain-containing protein [Pseudomonadota bacterium]